MVGKNGSGKTTILQAMRTCVARGRNSADANWRFLDPGVASIDRLDDMVRLEREADETRVVTYDQDELEIAAEQGIEVR